ncbi:hypothetical protein [Sphaerospermopsis sp. FACHB-1194]|uniref:hypothetical protein n=1 Tax=Sphaerospermopsis sp. FACHB-1194 TaxID=2692862 RepID=UPI0016808CC5|nr:hypothetical protein [Sphaerospermopsis sp. FACHB-1194]MBD2145729.1 hypothetical protein [Sphaerospermopsis sp. FACHB-1194]
MLRKSFREGIGVRSQESGVRSQESGGDLKISLPSLEIPKNAHFFRYTLQNPCTNFCVYQPLTFDPTFRTPQCHNR